MNNDTKACKRCIMDSTASAIRFDANGVCNYCTLNDRMEATHKHRTGTVEQLCQVMRKAGRKAPYDCVVGVSGGTDSTYCLYRVKQLGLRPLAVHFDNGWVSDTAHRNIQAIRDRLDVEVRSVTVDWNYLRAAYRACLEASVPELCMPCEIGIASSLYRIAAEAGVHYIVLGHSFRTEGITPLRWHYLDGRYFANILKRHGSKQETDLDFNRLKMLSLVNYMLRHRIRTVQLPLYIQDYRDEDIRARLQRELGWEYGGHHHFDCYYKPFVASIHERKFGVDLRKVSLSALIRSGQLTREQAAASLKEPFAASPADIDRCLERLGMSRDDLQRIIDTPPRGFRDYPTYYSFLSWMRMPLRTASRLGVVPETLYEKLFET